MTTPQPIDQALYKKIVDAVEPSDTVIDLGAGKGPYHMMLAKKVRRLVLVDAYRPYLDSLPVDLIGRENVEHMVGVCPGVFNDLKFFLRAKPVILGIDFIEHMTKADAEETIELAKKHARKIVLFVPEGNHPQNTDYYKMGGEHWQTHRSTWYASDFESLGFTVQRWVDFHAGFPGKDPNALFCTWERA